MKLLSCHCILRTKGVSVEYLNTEFIFLHLDWNIGNSSHDWKFNFVSSPIWT